MSYRAEYACMHEVWFSVSSSYVEVKECQDHDIPSQSLICYLDRGFRTLPFRYPPAWIYCLLGVRI